MLSKNCGIFVKSYGNSRLSLFISSSRRQPCDMQWFVGQMHMFPVWRSCHSCYLSSFGFISLLAEVNSPLRSQFKYLTLRNSATNPWSHLGYTPSLLVPKNPVIHFDCTHTISYTCDIWESLSVSFHKLQDCRDLPCLVLIISQHLT